MKISKITRVAVDRLRINEGQLDWLPRNPRQWTQTDIDRMVRSVEEDPDFADVRPVLATPAKDGTLIVFAHNLLTRAAQVRGDKTLPVATFTPETEEDQATIRRLAIKDNGSFGAWDTEALAADWKDLELGEWGVPAWKVSGNVNIDALFDPEKEAPVKPKPTIIEVSVPYGMEEKVEEIRAALREVARNYSGVTVV